MTKKLMFIAFLASLFTGSVAMSEGFKLGGKPNPALVIFSQTNDGGGLKLWTKLA